MRLAKSLHFSYYLVANRRKHFLVIIQSKLAIHARQSAGVRSRQDSQWNVYHLKILRACRRRDLSRSRANIVNDGILEPGNAKMKSFGVGIILNTGQATEDDRTMTTFDWNNRRHCERDGETTRITQLLRTIGFGNVSDFLRDSCTELFSIVSSFGTNAKNRKRTRNYKKQSIFHVLKVMSQCCRNID